MRSAYSCTTYRARVRKCRVLGNCLRSCFKLEVGRCGHDDNLLTNDQALCDYTDRSREQKPNGVRRQNALSAYSCPDLSYYSGGPDYPDPDGLLLRRPGLPGPGWTTSRAARTTRARMDYYSDGPNYPCRDGLLLKRPSLSGPG